MMARPKVDCDVMNRIDEACDQYLSIPPEYLTHQEKVKLLLDELDSQNSGPTGKVKENVGVSDTRDLGR